MKGAALAAWLAVTGLSVGCRKPATPPAGRTAPAAPVAALPSEPADAKELFELYEKLAAAFDPAVFDLYTDDASIRLTRIAPDGSKQEITLSGQQYKDIGRPSLPLAKSLGEIEVFSDIKFTPEGDDVRMTAQRCTTKDSRTAPHTMLMRKNAAGQWRIVEEVGSSHQ